jgi:Peptidase family M28
LGVLSGRIYRAAWLPLGLALTIAGFSLTGRAAPLASSLAPDAFEGSRAFAVLQGLARRFPDRTPCGAGDTGTADAVARDLRRLGGAGTGGWAVAAHRFEAQTIAGECTLTDVVAQRPGTTGEPPIVLMAHRDAAGRGAAAELGGTAVLLELARVLAAGETKRTIVLVSTSGGSGGHAGAAEFAEHAREWLGAGAGAGAEAGGEPVGAGGSAGGSPIDAAIVLGDTAGVKLRPPYVGAFSAGTGSADGTLVSTLDAALAAQAGLPAESPGGWAQAAHLLFPLTEGEQGPLDAAGMEAATIGADGERWTPAAEPVSEARLEGFGRAALSAVYALDGGPSVGGAGGMEFQIRHRSIPGWALRLVASALLLPALAALGDGFARARRRREPVGRWVAWTLACAAPFLLCALFVVALGRVGAIPAPRPPVSPEALPFDGAVPEAAAAAALVLLLGCSARPSLMRRLRLPRLPDDSDAAATAPPLVLGALAAVVWLFAPMTSLLLVVALHAWLLFASPLRPPSGRRGRPSLGAVALAAVGAAPLAAFAAVYAGRLGLGWGGAAHTALLLLAGGRIGIVGAVLWSIGFGSLAAVLAVAHAAPAPAPAGAGPGRPDGGGAGAAERITIRGPSSYAGPGSLGGTESALRH